MDSGGRVERTLSVSVPSPRTREGVWAATFPRTLARPNAGLSDFDALRLSCTTVSSVLPASHYLLCTLSASHAVPQGLKS